MLDSKKRRTFAGDFEKNHLRRWAAPQHKTSFLHSVCTILATLKNVRDLAQLVAHTSGGREVAGSSPVIPTKRKPKLLISNSLGFFYAVNWRDFGVITIFNGLSAVIQYFGIMFSL